MRLCRVMGGDWLPFDRPSGRTIVQNTPGRIQPRGMWDDRRGWVERILESRDSASHDIEPVVEACELLKLKDMVTGRQDEQEEELASEHTT